MEYLQVKPSSPSAFHCLPQTLGRSTKLVRPTPRGMRLSTIALTRSGARKASESSIVTERAERPSRAAKTSMLSTRPTARSSIQRRAMAIAKSSRDRVSEDMARGSSLCPFAGKMTSRCTRVGGLHQGTTIVLARLLSQSALQICRAARTPLRFGDISVHGSNRMDNLLKLTPSLGVARPVSEIKLGPKYDEKALTVCPDGTYDASVRRPVFGDGLWRVEVRKVMSKAAVAAVAALSLCAALVASSEPASAQFRHGGVGGFGGFHGGMGGFGGWHGGMGGWGGGWRTAGWRGGWRGGWGGWGWRGGWGGCRWGGCGWGGGRWWPRGSQRGRAGELSLLGRRLRLRLRQRLRTARTGLRADAAFISAAVG